MDSTARRQPLEFPRWLRRWPLVEAEENVSRERLMPILALGISAIWAIATLVSLVTKEYTPLVTITPLMLIVAGFVFGYRGGRNGGNGGGGGSG